MLQTIAAVNQAVNNFIWGVPAMVCIIGVGLPLSVRTGFIQIRKFPYAIKTTIGRMFRKRDASDGAMTPFQAVCTALAATGVPATLPVWRGLLPSAGRARCSGCGARLCWACVQNFPK